MFFNDLKTVVDTYNRNEMTKEEYEKFLKDNIIVNKYIPIAKKYAMISSFCSEFNKVVFDVDKSNQTEIELYSLLFGYTNIIIASDERNITNYDLIMSSGLYDYIYIKCKNDYDNIIEKCNRLNGIDNLWILSKLNDIFCNPMNVENIEKIKDIINNEVDKDKLKFINSIVEFNNPQIKSFFNKLEKDTVNEVKCDTK